MLTEFIETEIVLLLFVAIAVAVMVRRTKFPYTLALVFVGLFVAATGIEMIPLSKELILFLFLPPLLFEGAVHIHLDDIKANIKTISLLAVVGIIISVILIGAGLHYFVGMPLLYGMLFGAIISATDPVSVLALFKKLGVSKKLSTIVEGESLFNDGTSVVLFEIILGLVMLHEFSIMGSILEFLKVVVGGIVVGGIAGISVYALMRNIDDHLIEVMSTIVLTFGSFLLAEHLHVSGVIAVVIAGLLIGNYGKRFAMSPTTRVTIISFWEVVVFIINSIIFIMIGAAIPLSGFVHHMGLILLAIALVVVARAVSVYPLATLTDFFREKTPLSWQHIINWGGLRGSIPIALVLGIQSLDIPYKEEITLMTFGVVFFSLVVQGLTIAPLIRWLKVIEINPDKLEADRLLAEKAAIKCALRELEEIHDQGEISNLSYDKVKKEYELKFQNLKKEYHACVKGKTLLHEVEHYARKKALLAEKGALLDQMEKGLLGEEAGAELIRKKDQQMDQS